METTVPEWRQKLDKDLVNLIVGAMPLPTTENYMFAMESLTFQASMICCKIAGVQPDGNMIHAMSKAGYEAITEMGKKCVDDRRDRN